MVHTIHVVLAGAWLRGVLFTAFVVSLALEAMKWVEAERAGVRAEIGRRSFAEAVALGVAGVVGEPRGKRGGEGACRERLRAVGVAWLSIALAPLGQRVDQISSGRGVEGGPVWDVAVRVSEVSLGRGAEDERG